MQKSIQKNIFYGFCFIILFAGCSSMKPVQYPEVIYNYRQPLVSVTYEYGEIDIDIPIVFPGLVPNELSFEVYAKGDSIHPLLTVKSQPTDLMKVFLPQGVLGVDTKNNFIKIIPHHPDFVSLKVPFFGIDFGSIVLDPVHIVQQPLDVIGIVSNRLTDDPLNEVDVSLYMKDKLLQKVYSNEKGEYSLTLPGEFKDQEFLRIIAGEKLIFAPFRKDISFKKTKKLIVNIGLGPSQDLADLGNLYITNKNNVHFRDKPHIGGTTLFLLPEGEPIAVEQVSKGLYYGTIEILVSSGKSVKMSGWLEREDTDLLFFENIFKEEDENDQTL
ncbi:MAG: hypothetical protein CMG70_05955 [Candidatus Marinimicrobia bacterium]|nr:hypothetical protein [Candidatus Neomarinimicrobiota bacterium]|tara:strand:- start:2119 stop:3102 length:984 start_codon:yes stop_codon:yes gene_type:complete